MPKPPYDKSVFVNCPFDKDYLPLFYALIFAIQGAGFIPRSSLEFQDGIRISHIIKLIGKCRYGIHDISRTELSPKTKLPRFNMPLELGIDIGCTHFSGKRPRKSQLILDQTAYRYRKFISDLAGYDLKAHKNDPFKVIEIVRNWLSASGKTKNMPSVKFLKREYKIFMRHLPDISRKTKSPAEIPFTDYTYIVADWIEGRK